MVAVVPILIVLAVVAVIIAAGSANRRTHQIWAHAANQLGLDISAPSVFGNPTISGRSGSVTVDAGIVGSGDNARTRYRVAYSPLAPSFTLQRESGTRRIMKMFGGQDLEIGDPAFDDAFVVKADDSEALRAFLTAGRRSSLVRLLAVHNAATISESQIELRTKPERKTETIVAVVRRLAATAEQLVGKPTSAAVDDATRERELGNLGEALRRLDEAVATDPNDLDARLLRAQTAQSAGDTSHAEEDQTVLERLLPSDREVAGLGAASTRAVPVPSAAGDVDTAAMFDELFGTNRLSFETDKLFAKYQGRTVTLRGDVRSARPFERDLDFGDEPGTKVVVAVASISSDLYGNNEIDAVVRLPAIPGRPLDRHDTITFEGTLHKVDAMMRNVYVADGRLV